MPDKILLCTVCGEKIGPQDTYCPECGTELISHPKRSTSKKRTSGRRRPKRTVSQELPIVAVGIFVLVIGLGAALIESGFFTFNNESDASVDPFVQSTSDARQIPNQRGNLRLCGDGDCGAGETCTTCARDCGSCQTKTSDPRDRNQFTIKVGEKRTHRVGDVDVKVSISFIDRNMVRFILDDWRTTQLGNGSSEVTPEGTMIVIHQVKYEPFDGGDKSATYSLSR